jgi:hypothetical protein
MELRGIVGEERRGKETDRCPLTPVLTPYSWPPLYLVIVHESLMTPPAICLPSSIFERCLSMSTAIVPSYQRKEQSDDQ